MNETKKQEVKMTYYQRVQAYRDNQQALLDDFLAEVVSSKTITKSNENTKENRNKVYWQFVAEKFNRKTVNSFANQISKCEEKLAKAETDMEKELYKELILEAQYNVRFWDIARPLFNADRKLEQVKYFSSRYNR